MQAAPDHVKRKTVSTKPSQDAAKSASRLELTAPFEVLDCRHLPGFDDHDLVAACHDPDSGLQAFIAIHDTTLGPALGGCRMWPFASKDEAISDVLRLAQGMSYKHAVAGTGQGGGKAVIIGDPRADKSPELYRALGRFVEQLGGRYVTAEDVGTSVADLCYAKEETNHIAGLPVEMGGSGDPSPVTAYGVFCGIQAALAFRHGKPYSPHGPLDGVTVAVQGLGNVGYRLCQYLHESGAQLVVADIHKDIVDRAVTEFKARSCEPDHIHAQPSDVFAPCALGGVVNCETLPELGATIIAGAANNQLTGDSIGVELCQRGVLYAPDYVINAGGVINISFEQHGSYDHMAAIRRTERVGNTLMDIFEEAQSNGLSTAEVATRIAQRNLGLGQ